MSRVKPHPDKAFMSDNSSVMFFCKDRTVFFFPAVLLLAVLVGSNEF